MADLPPPVSPDVLDYLHSLGLSPLQVRVYVTLVTEGPRRANALYKSLGVDRVSIYRALKDLSRKGLVEVLFDTSHVYSAVKPRFAVKMLIGRFEEHLTSLVDRSAEVIEALESIRDARVIPDPVETVHPPSSFRLIRGVKVLDQCERMMRKAERKLSIVADEEGMRLLMDGGFMNQGWEVATRGVELRIITELGVMNLDAVREYSRFGKVKYLRDLADCLRHIIVDSREALIAVSERTVNLGELQATLTNNPVIVKGIMSDFERMWTQAEEIEQMDTEVQGSVA